ncbi:MAG: putative bifunctional diguanylate cyclase/phosphodiesterase, partial [Candidatus Bathyanammoxibius sp.]
YQLYNPAMQANSLDKLQLESSLHRAMERDELMVYYQPQVDLKTGKIVGAEALARWKHNQKGMVPAIEFIPLAENIGLIVPIGEWVLHAACTQNKKWQDAGLPPVRVAVNLSAHMFQKQGLVEVVDKVLKETGLDPNFLELEITETVLMKDIDAGARTLMELKDMGVHVAIDDFGTGYSSLSYLTRLPVDRLKIDQSFVRDLTIHPDDDAVVKATVALAHSLRLKAIAEGVETQAQLDFLRSADCDEIQGNLFHKPVTPDELEGLLKQGKRLEAVG